MRRLAWSTFLAALGIWGCGAVVERDINALLADNPDSVPRVSADALSPLIPATDVGRCGPTGLLTGLIPDCPVLEACFTAACAHHDICYSTCGSNQRACDDQFFWDMVSLCRGGFADRTPGIQDCYESAYVYYRVVQVYALSYFDRTQELVCSLGPLLNLATKAQTSTRVAAPPELYADLDGDALPDAWEVEHGLDCGDRADGLTDHDGDGRINLAELILGTDPLLPD